VRNACDHLLANAIDFSPAGGAIRVRLRGVAAAPDSIEGGALVCEFDNDGPAIAGDDLERIFTPFFSRRRQGTGLGLAVVRRVVEDHGGRVSAANRDGGGVRFTIALPLRS
jgi:signal transduction histidine kinase